MQNEMTTDRAEELVPLDTDGNEVSSVFSDGNSNSSIQLNVPAGFDVTIIGLNTTNYQIFGNVTSTTVPAFADQ